MFLLDDILMAPFKGLAAVCRQVYEAAQEDLESQEKAILATLAELYQELEAGGISDEEFNTRESVLLERFEAARNARSGQNGSAAESELHQELEAGDISDEEESVLLQRFEAARNARSGQNGSA